MKNKILIFTILIACACSALPKNNQGDLDNILFQKPDFTYKIKSLPAVINIYFFDDSDSSLIPREVQGFITNAFFYSSKISYNPKILISKINNDICDVNRERQDLIVAFNLSNTSINSAYQRCLQSFPRTETLYVSDNNDNLRFKNNFIVSRKEEKNKLIQAIKNNSINFIVIDSENTLDKENIKGLLEKNKKVILDTKTFENESNSQDLFEDILMVNRSKERARKISRRISKNLKVGLRIREDIDSFFLSVDLEEARNLKPALDFLSEEDFKVFILNSWKTNSGYKLLDKDIRESIHSDLPIMMPIEIPKHIPENKRSRQFAIGYDTFEIILLKYGGVNLDKFIYKGLSGKINLQRGEIKRSAYIFKITDNDVELL